MRIDKHNNQSVLEYDGVQDLVGFLRSERAKETELNSYALAYRQPEFCRMSFTQAMDELTGVTTTSAPSADVYRLFMDTMGAAMSVKLDTAYGVAGSYVDVGLYMSGEPECMVDFVEQPKRDSSVRVMLQLGNPGWVEQVAINNRAQAVSALVDVLRKDYNVVLSLVDSKELNGIKHNNSSLIMTNEYHACINIDTERSYSVNTIMALCSTPMLRRVMFRQREIMTGQPNLNHVGYGSSQPGSKSDANGLLEALGMTNKPCVYFHSFIDDRAGAEQCETIQGACDYVLNIARKGGLIA